MTTKFLLNTWYAAGFTGDFGRQPVLRKLLQRELVFYRTQSGRLVALDDRCPHRFAPLHQGRIIGDHLQCPYHGLEFGPNGACMKNPSRDGTIPAALKVGSYPVIEKNGVVWIWPGSEPADETALHRIPEIHRTGHDMVQGYIRVNAHYQLVVDNLLDLSHAEFLHPNLAAEGFNLRTQYTVTQDSDVVVANHWRPNVPISNLFRLAYGEDAPANVDHRAIAKWYPPSNLQLEVGVAPVGDDSNTGPTTLARHLITPESERVTHYFWQMGRDFRLGDHAFSEWFRDMIQAAFENEDEPMIEAQYRKMDGQPFDSLRPVLLPTDAATVRARRIVQRLLNEEAAAANTNPGGRHGVWS